LSEVPIDPIPFSASADLVAAPLLVLVSVAPSAPYPELFATGPQATWVRRPVPGVFVMTYSGLPVTSTRRQFVDVREMLRFPGAHPRNIGTIDNDSAAIRAYGHVVTLAAQAKDADASALVRSLGTATQASLVLGHRAIALWERTVTSRRKNANTGRVSIDGFHLLSHRRTTISNSMSIQQDLFAYLAAGPPIGGVLMTTASAYVDLDRFRDWATGDGRDVFIAGANALSARADGLAPLVFLSGFCQYFSWEAIRTVAQAKDLDHSGPNDQALTRWLLDRGIGWCDPGIVWSTTDLESGRCPLCSDGSKFVVRCTSHGNREREREFMRQLDHQHLPL
jgi:hypothetical protein